MLAKRSTLLLVMSSLVAFVQGQCALKFPMNTGHYCFKYIRQRMTYSEATAKCTQLGAVVAHPAAQDWGTWRQDVQAVTRNDHSLWVGTERTESGWYWLSTGYDGKPLPIDSESKKKGDNSIPYIAWYGSKHTCKMNFGNETIANETMAAINGTMGNETMGNDTMSNSTEKVPHYCESGTGNCAYFDTKGKLRVRDCEAKKDYVICQGPVDYTSSCTDQNCTDNAYRFPISFSLCGCKCRDGYVGDGYNHCGMTSADAIWAILGFVIGSLVIVGCCIAGVRKHLTYKTMEKKAVKKSWCTPCLGIVIGILIIWLCV